jgi:hypothetical protein
MSFELPKSVRGFHDYFKMPVDVETLLGAFEYAYQKDYLTLPAEVVDLETVGELKRYLQETLKVVQLDSEFARREFLLAPVLVRVALLLQVRIRTEQTVDVSPLLRGSLDYLLQSRRNLLVVEAKYADTTRGFKQLAVEMIALDKWDDFQGDVLYGAVSIGNIWQFATLQRATKTITEDLTLYTVPDGIDKLLGVLCGILRKES